MEKHTNDTFKVYPESFSHFSTRQLTRIIRPDMAEADVTSEQELLK